jgi:hypothetical protein
VTGSSVSLIVAFKSKTNGSGARVKPISKIRLSAILLLLVVGVIVVPIDVTFISNYVKFGQLVQAWQWEDTRTFR